MSLIIVGHNGSALNASCALNACHTLNTSCVLCWASCAPNYGHILNACRALNASCALNASYELNSRCALNASCALNSSCALNGSCALCCARCALNSWLCPRRLLAAGAARVNFTLPFGSMEE